MISKTRAGASFFTTQLLFDSEAITETLVSYDKLSRQSRISPATVVLSFAPVADETDIEFVRWLGADVPEESERRLISGDDPNTSVRCIALAHEVWDSVSQRAAADHLRVPSGINIEQVSPRHLDGAREMLAAFVDCLPRSGGTGNRIRPTLRGHPPLRRSLDRSPRMPRGRTSGHRLLALDEPRDPIENPPRRPKAS